MKSIYFLLAVTLFIAGNARAEDADFKRCVRVLMSNNPDYSRAKAEYGCTHPFSDQAPDSPQKQKWREEFAQDAADAQAENQRADHADRGE